MWGFKLILTSSIYYDQPPIWKSFSLDLLILHSEHQKWNKKYFKQKWLFTTPSSFSTIIYNLQLVKGWKSGWNKCIAKIFFTTSNITIFYISSEAPRQLLQHGTPVVDCAAVAALYPAIFPFCNFNNFACIHFYHPCSQYKARIRFIVCRAVYR